MTEGIFTEGWRTHNNEWADTRRNTVCYQGPNTYFTVRLLKPGETALRDKESKVTRNIVGEEIAICVPAGC